MESVLFVLAVVCVGVSMSMLVSLSMPVSMPVSKALVSGCEKIHPSQSERDTVFSARYIRKAHTNLHCGLSYCCLHQRTPHNASLWEPPVVAYIRKSHTKLNCRDSLLLLTLGKSTVIFCMGIQTGNTFPLLTPPI